MKGCGQAREKAANRKTELASAFWMFPEQNRRKVSGGDAFRCNGKNINMGQKT